MLDWLRWNIEHVKPDTPYITEGLVNGKDNNRTAISHRIVSCQTITIRNTEIELQKNPATASLLR